MKWTYVSWRTERPRKKGNNEAMSGTLWNLVRALKLAMAAIPHRIQHHRQCLQKDFPVRPFRLDRLIFSGAWL